jgi:hypothetical protein
MARVASMTDNENILLQHRFCLRYFHLVRQAMLTLCMVAQQPAPRRYRAPKIETPLEEWTHTILMGRWRIGTQTWTAPNTSIIYDITSDPWCSRASLTLR